MDVYVFDAVRTPRGKGRPDGALAKISPAKLVVTLVNALETRAGKEAVQNAGAFILGNVTQVGAQGGHLGLATRIQSGLPDTMPVITLNNFCASGLSAIANAVRRVALGEADLALAGGVESMSQVEFMSDKADYYSDMVLADQMGWVPVGLSADLVAARNGIDRAAMDEAVLRSHRRAADAWARGRYDARVIAVQDDAGDIALARDENIRDFGDGASLKRYPPVFAPFGEAGYDAILLRRFPDMETIPHLHTIAHCPPISDGAAMALIGTLEGGAKYGLKPIARIRAIAEAANDHVLQLTAGFRAMDLALARAQLELHDVGAIEFMEAFAAIPVKFERTYKPDMTRVNVNGGHLAMGHPMGATGAILFAATLDSMRDLEANTGLVVATGGMGVGAAMVLERV